MKRQFVFGTVFAAAMAVGAGAQGTGTQGQTGQQPGQEQQQRDQQQVTATGCLLPADQLERAGQTGAARTGQTGQPGQTGTAAEQQRRAEGSDKDKFVLLKPAGMAAFGVRPETQPGQTAQTPRPGQPGQTATGTTGAGADMHANMGYRLVGGEQHNLDRHVNKQVEVRGTVERDQTGRTGHPGQTGQPGQPGQTGQHQMGQTGMDVQHLPTLRVTSVREVASSCSAEDR